MTISHSPSPNNRRQLIIGLIFFIVILIVAWQVYSLFKGEGTTAPQARPTNIPNAPTQQPNLPPQPAVPKPTTTLPKPTLTIQEIEQIKLQKQNEERYINAVNQLQMLKIEQQIAEANKAIITAKLDTVKAQKSITDLSQPINSGVPFIPSVTPTAPTSTNSSADGINMLSSIYTVISVSQLQGKWSAVLSTKDKLYQVHVGDELPDTGAKIITIDSNGVMFKIGDEQRKLALISII